MRNLAAFYIPALCLGLISLENAPGAFTDAGAQFAAAQAAPCSTATVLYKSIAADATAPDSIRSRSFGLLAGYAFAQRDFVTARDNYGKAAALDKKNTRYSYQAGLSDLAAGDTAGAVKTFTGIALKNEPDVSNEARVELGRLAYARGDYKTAFDHYSGTGIFNPTNGWSVAASFGKLMCARALGLADSAAYYEKQLSPYSKTLLEKDAFAKIKGQAVLKGHDTGTATIQSAAIDTGEKTPSVKPGDGSSNPFTLQVGAFASEATALAMKKNLSKTFKEVSCVTAVVSARTFYRIWVGNFKTREAAEKFGQNELMQLGLVFRVVAK